MALSGVCVKDLHPECVVGYELGGVNSRENGVQPLAGSSREEKEGVCRMRISARNQIRGIVTAIKEGAVESQVTVDIGGQSMVAVVTMDAVASLGIAVGSSVIAVVKADSVMLAVD